MSLVIDIHALQTFPPSLINRDDTGAPKTANFGGVPRQRISSQAAKRAIRRYFQENVDSQLVGTRSKRIPGQIITKVRAEKPEWDPAEVTARVEQLFKDAKIKVSTPKAPKNQDADPDEKKEIFPETGYLLFLSPRQIDNAVAAIVNADGEKIGPKRAKELFDTEHSVDIAMFGRMVADDAAYNVDASVQVAHEISVHAETPEVDYFTAVDDLAASVEETGAGMIGTVQMIASTMYRFATVNVEALADNLGSMEAAANASEHFINAFIQSMPTGKQNTFANNTLPELVYVTVRDTRSISLVNAFETPVKEGDDRGRRRAAAEALAQEERDVEKVYGFVPKAAFVLALGDLAEPFDGLAQSVTFAQIGSAVRDALEVN
ncbi:type I-E CRISPR-associated protein Cas7/Cse4/CasC [Corynebacterium uberis]|uniref:type I-E CRISPR-associated protein Cas7/Cse4/CasC n=1 Tax=Corynebacterium TaxID=1716 RepID=UPI001D0BC6BA|nr:MULTISPECIES: type I-E CRISPR-associated protein Cas7/Cse4/CasC [Corynebacterium]MCZ9308322.1 type I-E CRISPR-associated protein Cas7/Cse4/CasC [Corynebacterium sp. c6VSa_13]UDL75120.1 type I-E CRISPR-associated protein Cas7/Cse4/CasC [Corynebacterium uberis]UDL77333.1 type I-E CRISPR-associated protein Cas7/Cse4/CasC [Corynebacterium uberis]UDL79617.1 type I-E CRISPR-associated protein Cas7/Cse4/CasC [Corynebacterium uberis]UDL81750.1 type I-E CRISPR-associated protein Cas7/Cse4/CasC [Cory